VESPAEAARLVRGLGETTVSVRGWETRDAAHLERILAGVDAWESSTFSFHDGRLEGDAADLLAALALSDAFYVDMDLACSPADTTSRSGLILTAARRARVRSWQDDLWLEGEIGPVRTDRQEDAVNDLRRWMAAHAIAPPAHVVGHVSGVRAESAPLVLAFAKATGARVDVALDSVRVDEAVALAERFPAVEVQWTTEHADVDFPRGEISTFLLAPVTDPVESAWRDRITSALKA
jgi:hypothetical protein